MIGNPAGAPIPESIVYRDISSTTGLAALNDREGDPGAPPVEG